MRPRRYCPRHTARPSCVLTTIPGLTGLSITACNLFSLVRPAQRNDVPDIRLLLT